MAAPAKEAPPAAPLRAVAPLCVGLGGLGLAGLGSASGGIGGAVGLPAALVALDLHLHRGLTEAVSSSSAMILCTELGDETFIMAAVMAMRHPKIPVLAGSLAALYLMTAISALLGVVLPNVLSQEAVHKCATALYCFFGLRLLWMGWRAQEESQDDEFKEASEALSAAEAEGQGVLQRALSRLLTPAFLEAFLLTLMAEWGDRSQIATVTLASQLNPLGVMAGAAAGHTACSSLAVFSGEWLGKRISQRAVACGGGLLFLAVGLH